MIRKKTVYGSVAVAMGLMIGASEAEGQLPYFRSSMKAQCIGVGGSVCGQIRFTLDVAGNNRIYALGLLNTNSELWDFASVQGIYGSDGQQVRWWTTVLNPSRLDVEFAGGTGAPTAEPIHVVVNMEGGTAGTPDKVSGGDFRYYGYGYQGTTGDARMQFGGTVTPEPITVALLATGLAGLGGAGLVRRRRRKANE